MEKTRASARIYKVGKVSPIESDKFNAFNEHIATDVARLSSVLNKIIDIVNSAGSLPDGSVSVESNALDGANIFVDVDASTSSVFYDESLPDGYGANGRPVTIAEALEAIYQVVSSGTQHVREGVRIGSQDAPITIAASGTYTISWGYSDAIFVPYLYTAPPNVAQAGDISVSLDTTSNTITIQNNSLSSQDIWGVIWHPSFAF